MIAFVTDKKSFSYKIMKTGGTFIIAAVLFLSLQAQTPVAGDDGTVRATSSSLHKAGKELLVSVGITSYLYQQPKTTHHIFARSRQEGKRSRSIAKKKRKSADNALSAICTFRKLDESCHSLTR